MGALRSFGDAGNVYRIMYLEKYIFQLGWEFSELKKKLKSLEKEVERLKGRK